MLKANINPFQSSVVFHIETSHLFCSDDWSLYETQHWAEMYQIHWSNIIDCLIQTFFNSFLSTLNMYFPHGITIFPCNLQQKIFRKIPRMHVSKMHVSSLQALKQKDCGCFGCCLLQNWGSLRIVLN